MMKYIILFDYYSYFWYSYVMEMRRFDNDEALLRGCIDKDHAAWDHFTAKYSGLILASATNRLRKYGMSLKQDDLKDVQQNVLSCLWEDEKLAQVREARSLPYWLSIVSGNMALEHARKKRSLEKLMPVSIFDKIGDIELEDMISSGGLTPPDEIDRAETARRIEAAVEELPEKDRLVIKLNVIHGKKHGEIADILQIPAGTVSKHIRRAKESLKKSLKYLH